AALLEEPRYASARYAQLLAEPAMGDLEAPHGWPALFSVGRGGGTVFAFERGEIGARRTELLIQSAALGIGDGAGRVLRLDPVIDERIEQEFFSHVLEEVLLSPRSKTMVTRRSPTRSRTSRSSRGKAFVNAASTSPVITNNGSPERSLIQ